MINKKNKSSKHNKENKENKDVYLNKKKESVKCYVGKQRNTIVLTLIIVVFSLGFFLGKISFDKSLDNFEVEYKELELDLNSIVQRVSFIEYLGEDFCDNSLISTLGSDLFNIGGILVELEENEEIDTKKYDILKQKYNVNQVLFYSILKKYKSSCNFSDDVVLFFFEDSQSSKKQGEVLSQIYENNPDVKIISMDYNYTESLKYFYNYYNVKQLPFVVVNYNKTFSGFTSKEVLEKYLINVNN